jgi:hypothetical protein
MRAYTLIDSLNRFGRYVAPGASIHALFLDLYGVRILRENSEPVLRQLILKGLVGRSRILTFQKISLGIRRIDFQSVFFYIYRDQPASITALEPVTVRLFTKHKTCSATSL